ncbi:MAG: zinc ABC transporter substrate-binding protein [Pseudomonadota bacterium]
MHRRTFLASTSALAAVTVAGGAALSANNGARSVVATFSILGDMVQRVAGAHAQVTTLVGANGDTHVYSPTPTDAQALSKADLLVVNGLEFEGWLDRLIDASDFNGERIVATDGIDLIAYDGDQDGHHEDGDKEEHGHSDHAEKDDHGHEDHAEKDDHGHEDHAKKDDDHDAEDDHHGHDHGAFDPHGWQSVQNAVIYVNNIAAALSKIAPESADAFEANRAGYIAELEALDSDVRALFETLPPERRTIVTSHDAFQYFGRAYGLTFLAPQGLGTESEASAKDVARLIRQIREQNISAVFVENVADKRLVQQIAAETGVKIGGTLYPGALSGPDGPAPTYLEMIRHNATTLAQALSS